MAWCITNIKQGTIFYLLANKQTTVGRKDTDLTVIDDASVSRKHANIFVSHSECHLKYPEKRSVLTIRDLRSKFGTFVNGKQVTDMGQILKEDDVITFGQMGSNYRVSYHPIIVTTSCLENPDKTVLKNTILQLGGHLVSEWRDDCTHLVMSDVKVTIKAVCALVSLKPLVTGQFFHDLVILCNQPDCYPEEKNYIPKIGEAALVESNVNFNIVPERKTIFCGKTFVFLSTAQHKKLSMPLSIGGAKSVLISDGNINLYKSIKQMIAKKNACVIDTNTYPLMGQAADISILLRANKRRFIPESDIGLAVVHCSTEQYCNSDYEPIGSSQSGLQSQSLSQSQFAPVDSQVSQSLFASSHKGNTTIGSSSLFSSNSKGNTSMESASLFQSEASTSTSLILPLIDSEPEGNKITEPFVKAKRKFASSPERETSSKRIALEETQEMELMPETTIDTPIKETGWEEKETSPEVQVKIEQDSMMESAVGMEIVNDPANENLFPENEAPCARLPIGFVDVSEMKKKSKIVKQENSEPEYPSNLMVTAFVNLVLKRNQQPVIVQDNRKNFKQFRKNVNKGADCLPRIIGASDMIVYNQRAGDHCSDSYM